MDKSTVALILAAGQGTRMHSGKPKVLQTVLGEPMLVYVLKALQPIFGDKNVWLVVGHKHEEVEATFPEVPCVLQTEQLGTGHALFQALPVLRKAGYQRVLVVNGDLPLLAEDFVRTFLDKSQHLDLSFATIVLDDPACYGRVVRQNGKVQAIVEAKDYDPNLYGAASGEVNAGIYAIDLNLAEQLLPLIGNNNKSGEYYLTDLVALALAQNYSVDGLACDADKSLLGVNTPLELSLLEEDLRALVADKLLRSGVLLHAPNLVCVSPFAHIEAGAEITGPCEIYGRSYIHSGAKISSHCFIKNCDIASDVVIQPFCHLEGASIAQAVQVGPFARLRPGAELDEHSRVGNFVELKKTYLGKGAKANHLSYLGDAQIGAEVNIGAGTITCNYDGKHKYQTHIGTKAFIGSNTALVAPVNVGQNALIGAGSVITKDVPDDNLGIARGRQKNLQRKL